MANDAKFSLSEDALPELEAFFSEAVKEAAQSVLKVFQELQEINSAARYQIVINKTAEFAAHYSEEFSSEVYSLFDTWYEEGESVHQFIIDLEAAQDDGDESVQAAYNLESAMRQSLQDAFSQEPELYQGSDLVDLTGYGGKEKLFTDIDEILQNFDKEMDEAIDNADSTSNDKGEDNQIYINIGGVLSSILSAYKSFFESFKEGMNENLSEYVSTNNESAMGTVESDKEHLKGTAENAGNMLKEISSLFQL
ncbi:MAG: hypothetical protein HFG54_02090 [Lachnospiraceae bacterium]|jgi:hypothetical protein|nr:hypothetical protein [Lachnospiraceae bacterium]